MRSSFYRPSLAALALAGLAVTWPAAAQFARPDQAIRYRRAVFTLMNTHFGRIAAMANGKVAFDAKAVASNAEIATMLSTLPYVAFLPGTDKGDTKALPEVWTERDQFDAAAKKMQGEMAKLNAAAKSGNLDAIKAAVAATDDACSACHDNYRKQ